MILAATGPGERASPAALAARAGEVILPRRASGQAPRLELAPEARLRVSVDLGTAYLVLTVLDESGWPLAGEWQPAVVVRDGLVVDFIGAVDLVKGMKTRLETRLGRPLHQAASGYPPGVPAAEVRAVAHVLEAAGLECAALVAEPEAANRVLGIKDGVVVDVGGGTTGLAVIEDGRVVYTADEATGGTHFSLVIAGALDLPFEQAEELKTNPAEQERLFPLVRPVMEKVAAIILAHTRGRQVPGITLVGGGAAFPGIGRVVQEYTGIPVSVPEHPLFITPVGLALSCPPA